MEDSNIDIRDGFYDREFKELRGIGKESYGEVFEAIKKNENKNYAVKKIFLGNQTKLDSLKEFQLFSILSKINSNDRRVVKYFDVWLESSGKPNHENIILFIQMEFYEKTLREIIEEILNDPNLKEKDRLTPFGYYIASEIYLEIVRGVKSLHDQNPQIIHRNLNPESIRLTNKPNEKLVRITDFGDATSHEYDGQSHTQNKGSLIYAAPEVLDGKKYDTRADIYSLGILQGKLFNVDINSEDREKDKSCRTLLDEKYSKINKLNEKMLSRRFKERPDCQEILSDEKSWALSRNELEENFNIRDIPDLKNKYDSSFIYKIIFNKIIENTVGEVNELSLFIRDDFYGKEFIEVKPLGGGCYGQVFKVNKRANDNEIYAIKKIEFNLDQEKQFLKELITSSFITKLRNERLALYYDVWLENMTLYIQMELCDEKRLKDAIIEMQEDSDLYRNTSLNLTLLGYYIASKIFIEILEGVNYLHKENIIHRDLKPDNILFKLDADGVNFVKIADFGLVAIHKTADKARNKFAESQHTIGIGAGRYAPDEKKYGRKYDSRADIYSLGMIAEELFFVNINRCYKDEAKTLSELLSSKYQEMSDLCNQMTQRKVDDRIQTIDKILEFKHKWSLNKVEQSGNFDAQEELNKIEKMRKIQKIILTQTHGVTEPFVYSILRRKLLF